jgi:hypothetical protein
MQEKSVRIRIHPHLYKRFKLVCVKYELSIPKQTGELIRKFVEMQEENEKFMKG